MVNTGTNKPICDEKVLCKRFLKKGMAETGARTLTWICETATLAGMRTTQITTLGDNLAKLLSLVADSGEPLIVTKNGRPMVAITAVTEADVEEWAWEQMNDEMDARAKRLKVTR